MNRWTIAIIYLAVLLAGACYSDEQPPVEWPTVGIEASASALLPRGDLTAEGTKERADLILRIVSVQPQGDGYVYDLRYIGLLPGSYNLVDYLVAPGETRVTTISPVSVTVRPLLPPGHQGELVSQRLRSHTLPGGYKLFSAVIWVLWALLLVPLIFAFREKKVLSEDVDLPPPTLADLLRPLVEKALDGSLDVSGKEHLERVLTGYWKNELNLDEASAYQILRKIKQHPEGGKLIEQLENWLHRPPGRAQVDIDELLTPYITISGSSGKQESVE